MLQIKNLSFHYSNSSSAQLFVPEFSLDAGDHAVVIGPSGCGKSTLLHLLAAILTPQQGTLTVANTDLMSLQGRAADAWRGNTVGFLPQKLALVPSLSIRENLLLAGYANGENMDSTRADTLLEALGLSGKGAAKPAQLSQGQQQRAAIGRAMFNSPRLLLADEPTANLDDASCDATITLLAAQATANGASLVIATHDARVLAALPSAKVLRLETPVKEAA